jgi:hypothetical protein
MSRQDSFDPADRSIGPEGGSGFVTAITLVAVLAALVSMATGPEASPPLATPIAAAAPERFDPSRFILNALLAPALDDDAVPLRWVDPRPRSGCGPATEVRVNHAPLVAGALVPVVPFDIEWQADGCRPFGAHGPRYDGAVRLVVFREEWGLSAIVESRGLRVAYAGHESPLAPSSGAWLPFVGDAFEPVELSSVSEGD